MILLSLYKWVVHLSLFSYQKLNSHFRFQPQKKTDLYQFQPFF